MPTYSLSGTVVSANQQRPLAGLRVEAWDKDLLIDDLLGSAITNSSGLFVMEFDERYFQELIFDRRPDVYFKVFSGDRLLFDTKDQVLWNVSRVPELVLLSVPDEALTGGGATGSAVVKGRVMTAARLPLPNLRVAAYDKGMDGLTLLSQTTTAANGSYNIHYLTSGLKGKTQADLELRVFAEANLETQLAHSEVRYGASNDETIDFIIAGQDHLRGAEYDRLLAALQPYLAGKAMKDLKEDGEAQNITYLAFKSGWDPRVVAMAACAAQLSATTGIAASHYYALFRAGANSDANAINGLSGGVISAIVTKAMENGVIPRDNSLPQTLQIHNAQSASHALANPVGGAISSLGAMLDLHLTSGEKKVFLEAHQATQNDPARLWERLAEKGISQESIKRLRADAKLGFLTLQNAPLIATLSGRLNVNTPEDLVRSGLYKAEAWHSILADHVAEGFGLEEYAAGLATQVNLNYPTLVTADLVRRGEINVERQAPEAPVSRFLEAAYPKFEIGVHPVKTWDGYAHLDAQTRSAVKKVERLYQMSPSNESMVALAHAGIDSAYKVMSYTQEGFVSQFGDNFPSHKEARMVYHKAAQIHGTALNFVTQYFALKNNPPLYAVNGASGANGEAIVAPPTLEALFGSIDYCACSHCQSVLSPAAYLVDLLQFIDLEHVPHTLDNPLDVLFGRRPDIQHILLTCENTNVALPYLDLVNEVLEYYIVNGSLVNFEGHNTDADAKTPELLADPQYVKDTAYDPAYANVYPLSLPFNRPLEALRLIVESLGVTLAEAFRIFQTPLLARREILNLNALEYDILVGAASRTTPEYYGLAAAADIAALNTAVGNAKIYCRNTDLKYADLVALLKTRFINPGVVILPQLKALGLTMQQVANFYSGSPLPPLPPGVDQTPYTPSVPHWLTDHEGHIMRLITLSDQHPESTACDFGNMELRFANPDDTQNKLDMLAYDRLHRFIRLWRKLGWSLEFTDTVITALLPVTADQLTGGNIDGHFVTLLARIANFRRLVKLQKIPEKKLPSWLSLWDATLPAPDRKAFLGKLIKAGATDLEELLTITGFDPLANDMEADEPSLLRFIQAWQLLKASGAKVVDVDYVLRNADLAGKLGLDAKILHGQVKQLRDGLAAIDASLAVAPDSPDLDYARSKMALVYDNDVVTDFFGLISNTTAYTAPFVLALDGLPTAVTDADPALGYDAFKNLLTYSGRLTTSSQAAIAAAAAGLIANMADFNTALQALVDAGNADYANLDANYHELAQLYDLVAAAPDDTTKTDIILSTILPNLRDKLKTNALRLVLVAILKSDQPSVDALTGGKDVLYAMSNHNLPVLADFRALESEFVLTANGVFDFYVSAPATDDYILYLQSQNGTTVDLTVDGGPAVIANQTITVVAPDTTGEVQSTGQLSWTAGGFHLLRLTVSNLPASGNVTLNWRTKGMAKTPVPAANTYLLSTVANAEQSLIRLQKAALLQGMLKFTPREMAYFAGVNTETQGILNGMAGTGLVSGNDLHDQWARLALLLQFVLLKKENEPEQDVWVQLVENPSLATPQGQSLLLNVNGWTQADLDQVLQHFTYTQAELSTLTKLYLVREAMALVLTTAYSGADLRAWIVDAPTADLIRTIKSVMRSRLDDTGWLETMQSISDALRNRCRDAMVAFIIHHDPPSPEIENADQLYEYFLIDVQMDACMLTSRIRMALSGVQLFIMRCMMNLEPQVSPDSIRANQWAWMKRYRVWEANRKIFLFPENWLEPELRDNKSPFFKELEGELLKSDITDELAEDAFLHYLKKLDEVAYLEVAGTYLQEREKGNEKDDILHVIGRTNGSTRQYYYRRYEGGTWTAWEKVSLQIEGDIVYPVVWKGKLFVFWLSTLTKSLPPPTGTTWHLANQEWSQYAKVNAEITLCWGEYYKGKWTAPKSSELKKPCIFKDLPTFDSTKLELFAKTFTPQKPGVKLSEKLVFDLWYLGMAPSLTRCAKITFTSKNTPPRIELGVYDSDLAAKVDLFTDRVFLDPYSGSYPWHMGYDQNSIAWPATAFKVNVAQPANAAKSVQNYTLTTKRNTLFPGYAVRPLMHPAENQWNASFFYRDEHSQFFVEPTEKVVLVREETGYYFPTTPVVVEAVDIPPLIEQSQLPDPAGPVINPGDFFINNPAIQVTLPVEASFQFGNLLFGGAGQVNAGQLGGARGGAIGGP